MQPFDPWLQNCVQINHTVEWGKINPGFSLVKNPPNAGNQPMRNQNSFPPTVWIIWAQIGISGQNLTRISWNIRILSNTNFLFLLAGSNRDILIFLGVPDPSYQGSTPKVFKSLFQVPFLTRTILCSKKCLVSTF